jgi:carboxymethylenebutenolidase
MNVVVSRQYVEVPVDGRAMRAYLAAPRAACVHPGIVFWSDIFQLTEPTLRWCTRLAGYGFVVAAPEIYHRLEPAGTLLEFDDAGKARGQRDAEQTPVADFDADIAAALSFLAQHPAVAGRPLGAAGHCTGGHLAFRAALLPEVEATACWYPTGLHDGRLGADPDAGSLARGGEIDGELLLIFGTRDPHTPEAGRETIRRRLEQAGTRLTWREYDAEHAFGRDVGDRYDPEATDRAFADTVGLFRRSLAAAG